MPELSAAVVPIVLGGYWSLQFVYFVRRVCRYAETHSTADTVAFADAIRPPLVAAVSKISTAVAARRAPPLSDTGRPDAQ